MFRFKIISIGKLQERYLQEGESEYIKRIKKFASISFEELVINHSKKLTDQQIKKIESERLIEKAQNSYSVALSEQGKQFNSLQFSKFLENSFTNKASEISFLIAGALGWDRDIMTRANQTFSLSPLTFPHHVARFVLVEQLYRAVTIINGHPYNK